MLTITLAQILIVMAATYLWLYLNGDEYTTITGGWVSQAWSGVAASWAATAPSLTKETATLLIYLTNVNTTAKSGVVGITDLVDLSAVSTIRVTLPSATFSAINTPGSGREQKMWLFVSDVTTGDWLGSGVYDALSLVHSHTAGTTESLTNVSYTLDVSALTGSYRVYLGFEWAYQTGISTIRVSSVEMIAG